MEEPYGMWKRSQGWKARGKRPWGHGRGVVKWGETWTVKMDRRPPAVPTFASLQGLQL